MPPTQSAALAKLQPRRPRDTLGRPLRDLRISVTDRCNFRCPYCMPRERFHEHYRFLKSTQRLSFEEIVRLARLFLHLGVCKLRVTGGEPLLRAGLADLIGDLTSLSGVEDVALTTNGVLLAQHAAELRAAGLNRVTVSLDSLDPEVFARMAGDLGSPDEVLAGIRAAQRAGLTPVKVNAVVQRGINDHTVLSLLEHFRGTGVTVRLIEYMDVGNRNEWRREQVVPSKELLQLVSERWPLRPLQRDFVGEVAERHAYIDGQGEVGFISSVTQPFCGDCSRARLSSDGVLYTCLFASQGLDLRAPLRAGASDDELLDAIRGCWLRRADRYSELRGRVDLHGAARVEMNHVGG
jgi:cyclic pyranopterin phosphate synthase